MGWRETSTQVQEVVMSPPRSKKTQEIEECIRNSPTISNVKWAEKFKVSSQRIDQIRHRIGMFLPSSSLPPGIRVCLECDDRMILNHPIDAGFIIYRTCKKCNGLSQTMRIALKCSYCGVEFERSGAKRRAHIANHNRRPQAKIACPNCVGKQLKREG